MSDTIAEVVICGAGIAGVAAAYHLAVKRDLRDIVLVEPGAPLSLTSDKSTEAYRNWWPGPGDAMVAFMNRSIDLLEEIARATDNRIQLNRRGYLYATADPARIALLRQAAEEAAALGAGPLRVHSRNDERETMNDEGIALAHRSSLIVHRSEYVPAPAHGFENQPDGADLLLDPALIRAHFPYVAENTVALLHARRCGWFSAQQLGMYMLEQAREHGVRLVRGQVAGVDASGAPGSTSTTSRMPCLTAR